ncbi:unnamed protein product [Prorocentrum cordatum]|uniref:Uncharacterized protein n=1 Tax=Prorocentrum cordatum TaxID=2364126 RepID=A0ABN9V2V9_9DINO|nr:unnamed protein product [Polarella glacialis]
MDNPLLPSVLEKFPGVEASSLPWPPDANDWDLKGLEMFVGSGGFLKPKRRAEAPKPAPAPAPPAAGGPAPAAAAASAPGAPAEKGYPAGRAAPAPAAITSGGRRLGRGARGRARMACHRWPLRR